MAIKSSTDVRAAVQSIANMIDGQKVKTASGKTCELEAKVAPDASFEGPFAGPHDTYASLAEELGKPVADRKMPWGTNDPAMKDFVVIDVTMKRAMRSDVFVAQVAFRPPLDGEPGKSAIRVNEYNCYYSTPGLQPEDLFSVIEKAHSGQEVFSPDIKVEDPCA